VQQAHELAQVGGAFGAVLFHFRHFGSVQIEYGALVASLHQTARHIRAHLSESHHSDLHDHNYTMSG
jgi:hypothetical protein